MFANNKAPGEGDWDWEELLTTTGPAAGCASDSKMLRHHPGCSDEMVMDPRSPSGRGTALMTGVVPVL